MIRDADCVVQGGVGGRRFPSDTQGAFGFDAKDTRTSSQYAGMRRETFILFESTSPLLVLI